MGKVRGELEDLAFHTQIRQLRKESPLQSRLNGIEGEQFLLRNVEDTLVEQLRGAWEDVAGWG